MHMKVNYHTHTYRCRHAEGTDREYVEAAIAAGIKVVGFSDHAPIPFADGFVSSSRMAMDELEGYVNSIRSLQQEYKSDIRILLGYEAEYYPDEFASMIAHLEQYGYDFLILGQHYLGREQDGRAVGNCGDDQSLQDYVDQVLAGLETGKFLSGPSRYDQLPRPRENMFNALVTICQKLKELNMPLSTTSGAETTDTATTTLLRPPRLWVIPLFSVPTPINPMYLLESKMSMLPGN